MNKRFFLTVLIIVFIALSSKLYAFYEMPDTNTVKEGGIIRIKIGDDKPLKAAQVLFLGKKYPVFYKNWDIKEISYEYFAIIPVPLGTSGWKKLTIGYKDTGEQGEKQEKINVRKLKLKIVSIQTGMINDSLMDSLSKEGKIIENLQENTTTVKFSFPFIRPIKGIVSSEFGAKRIYDKGKASWCHKGIDIAAPEGTTVVADAGGTVVAALKTEGHGNFIMIDHGGGVYTLFMHLKNLIAKKGDVVKPGDVIGTVGSTGLSTGPHLHWQINVFSVPVNPTEFLAGF